MATIPTKTLPSGDKLPIVCHNPSQRSLSRSGNFLLRIYANCDQRLHMGQERHGSQTLEITSTARRLRQSKRQLRLATGISMELRVGLMTDQVNELRKLTAVFKVYNTEAELGIAITECGVPRSELFVTTKSLGVEDVEGALVASLSKLQTDYVDL